MDNKIKIMFKRDVMLLKGFMEVAAHVISLLATQVMVMRPSSAQAQHV